jgi:pyrroline-5-carboxylate reductase
MAIPAPMRLGFLGTGTIASAVVTGLCTDQANTCRIVLSPRNPQVAARLASAFAQVRVAGSNQDVIDVSDTVFLAVRPQVAQEVLAALAFRPEQRIISLVAMHSRDRIAALVRPAASVCCAVPLPTVAMGLGPTVIFPPDPVAASLFNRLGMAVEVANESELQALWASTALMATYFTLLDTVASWLAGRGVSASTAREYIAMVFDGLGRVPRQSGAPFAQLAAEFKTRGGLNEQAAEQLRRSGVFDACALALDAILARIEGGNATAALAHAPAAAARADPGKG